MKRVNSMGNNPLFAVKQWVIYLTVLFIQMNLIFTEEPTNAIHFRALRIGSF